MSIKKVSITGLTCIQTQEEELNAIKNRSLQVEKDVLSFKTVGKHQTLTAINVMQQTVNTLTSQTNSLRVNEQARSQDFLALFNMTVDTKNNLAEFSKTVNSQIQELGYNQTVSLVAIEHNMTGELYDLRINKNKAFMDIRNMVRAAENRANGTLALLQNQISQSVEKGTLIKQFRCVQLPIPVLLIFICIPLRSRQLRNAQSSKYSF
ncbi:unnamed protein product [Mytilus edulis]|uniref:Uncharacterized protein n=1 Tax=Mytilus edulis TaxID=6550 RepID=A0A8S3Q524_MYTED|nr:unnamed protein product [Mytilus edulis]